MKIYTQRNKRIMERDNLSRAHMLLRIANSTLYANALRKQHIRISINACVLQLHTLTVFIVSDTKKYMGKLREDIRKCDVQLQHTASVGNINPLTPRRTLQFYFKKGSLKKIL